MDAKAENNLFKSLGRIEAKIEGMCSKNKERHKDVKDLSDKLDDTFKNLPCGAQYKLCQDEIKGKMSLKNAIVVLGFVFTLLCGGYAYTFINSEHLTEHAQDREVHFIMPDVPMKK